MSYIFISYSREDRTYVLGLAGSLEERQIPVWIDSQLRAGEIWWQQISRAIRDCAGMIVIMSPSAEKSKWVSKEIALAEETDKPILPLLLAGKCFDGFLGVHYENATHGHLPSDQYYAAIQQILSNAPTISPISQPMPSLPPPSTESVLKEQVGGVLDPFIALRDYYPEIIAQMPKHFNSHDFIRKLAKHAQSEYVLALAKYSDSATPFRTVHGRLAKMLREADHLIQYVGEETSIDIFGEQNKSAVWEKYT